MAVHARIRAVFGHFQNLNLLALLRDLSSGRTAVRSWSSGTLLCPIAHGLPARQDVVALNLLGQTDELIRGCDHAARRLGADPASVLHFVRSWDEESIGAGWLLAQLEELWAERLEDAETVQALLQGEDPPSKGWVEEGCDDEEEESWLHNPPA
jgi:hypothetical protein